MKLIRRNEHIKYDKAHSKKWINKRGVISGSHACRDCVWHIILDAELHTTCPGERVLVATRFKVTFLPLRLCYENTRSCFSKDAENLVCIRHYSLNTIIAVYSVNE